MPQTKVFIIGIGGQLGAKLAISAARAGLEVYGGHMSRSWSQGTHESVRFDKTDRASVSGALNLVKPDVVVDTGAMHNVDYCETHPDESMAVNASGTLTVAQECSALGARLVFVSTDFVFDGVGAPYTEYSKPNPLSVYARSKLLGEANTLSFPRNCVVRPSVIYSWVPEQRLAQGSASGKPLNFAAWLVAQLRSGKPVNIVHDQFASPTLADDLAGSILALVRRGKSGLFHTAGATPLSRYDFSIRLAQRLELEERLIHAVPSSSLRQGARRPLNSTLISDKIRRETGYSMMEINEALDIFAREAAAEVHS